MNEIDFSKFDYYAFKDTGDDIYEIDKSNNSGNVAIAKSMIVNNSYEEFFKETYEINEFLITEGLSNSHVYGDSIILDCFHFFYKKIDEKGPRVTFHSFDLEIIFSINFEADEIYNISTIEHYPDDHSNYTKIKYIENASEKMNIKNVYDITEYIVAYVYLDHEDIDGEELYYYDKGQMRSFRYKKIKDEKDLKNYKIQNTFK